MIIKIQNPSIFLPSVIDGRKELCKCAARAQASRGKKVVYQTLDFIEGHNDHWNSNVQLLRDAERFIGKLLNYKPHAHESVLEHGNIGIDFVMSRIATHEIVRHRHCGITQESTRYVPLHNASELIFIKPPQYSNLDLGEYEIDKLLPNWATRAYESYLNYTLEHEDGVKRESARYLLPHCISSNISITANLREWRHIIRLRTSKKAAPEMQFIFCEVKEYFRKVSPVLVEDLE